MLRNLEDSVLILETGKKSNMVYVKQLTSTTFEESKVLQRKQYSSFLQSKDHYTDSHDAIPKSTQNLVQEKLL